VESFDSLSEPDIVLPQELLWQSLLHLVPAAYNLPHPFSSFIRTQLPSPFGMRARTGHLLRSICNQRKLAMATQLCRAGLHRRREPSQSRVRSVSDLSMGLRFYSVPLRRSISPEQQTFVAQLAGDEHCPMQSPSIPHRCGMSATQL
jgi:hypothetical protein